MPQTPVIIPLLNPNEPDAILRTLNVKEGDWLVKGHPIGTLETTKSTAELEASADGYVVGLSIQPGELAPAGATMCYLADSPDWRPPIPAPEPSTSSGDIPAGLRISQPALALARRHNLELALLPSGPLVTESMVKAAVQKRTSPQLAAPSVDFDPTAIIVYGGGGHGKALIDLIRRLGAYQIAGVVDDTLKPEGEVMGVQYLGGVQVLPDLYGRGVRLAANAVGGIGNPASRLKIFQRLAEAGFACPTLVHPAAFVETSARLSPGVQIMPQAYVGSEARVGFGVIVNTGAIISHDCILEDYANISPGAILAGDVRVGMGVLIGMGATVTLHVTIGAGTRIGNGATIKADVPENSLVQAGASWPA